MLKRRLLKTSWCQLQKRYVQNNAESSAKKKGEYDLPQIRNIGILAHIDAGKTTTTERMLYYSGLISNMGEVHHGNTVTDYMEQERSRGITITSAAVTFDWKNYRINLIDTPGHIDFTMEVEQTLRVLDGAIVILDGSAGVEAQTLTVCRQADKYNVPRIIYVNKMDRQDANFEMSLSSIESKLNVITLPTQYPIKDKGILGGIIDIVTQEKIIFNKKDQGMNYTRIKLSEGEDGKLWELAAEKRRLLTDKLSGIDEILADIIIEQESLDKIPSKLLMESLRRSALSQQGIPVLLGSSYKNIGVQPLMDAVLLYLPSPNQNKNSKQYACFNNDLSARVFKIIHDRQRGPITFLRIYTGGMKKGDKIYNIQREKSEQIGRLYMACADDYHEISVIGAGNIVAVTGLKSTITGDLITSGASATSRAKKNLEKINKKGPITDDSLFTIGGRLLEPVFFCSIEAPSLSSQSALETALQELQREDPSLRVTSDEETHQTILAGMGELHIEIIKERIRSEYKIDAELGALQISYRETIQRPAKDTFTTEYKVGDSKHRVMVTLSVIPNYEGTEKLLLDRSQDTAANIDAIYPKTMQAIRKGVQAALCHGPKLSCPVMNVAVKLHWLETGRGTVSSIVSAAVNQAVKKLLEEGGVALLEPIMHLEIVVTEEYSSVVLADLSKRRSEIKHIDVRGPNKVFDTLTPLSELLGYSTALRIMTSGHATFSLEFDHYRLMDPCSEQEAIRRVTGF